MCVDFCLVGFEPYRELVRLISVVVLLSFAFVCKFGLFGFLLEICYNLSD